MYEKESCAGGVFSVVTFFPSLFRRKTSLHIHQMKCIAQVTLHCYKQRFQDKCFMVHLFFGISVVAFVNFVYTACISCLLKFRLNTIHNSACLNFIQKKTSYRPVYTRFPLRIVYIYAIGLLYFSFQLHCLGDWNFRLAGQITVLDSFIKVAATRLDSSVQTLVLSADILQHSVLLCFGVGGILVKGLIICSQNVSF